jgi:DNA-directed RNA polymerase specialized sigma24 family protein
VGAAGSGRAGAGRGARAVALSAARRHARRYHAGTMAIPLDTLAAARRLSTPAVTEVLREHYPSVHRLAHGLAGRADVGAGIVRYVMHRSVAIMPSWRDEELAPENWFHHFTVITARRSIKRRPEPSEDILLGDTGVAPDPEYVAFLAALRNLPHQQQEAFILHHCERLGARTSSLAMDCSTEAAGNHLRAATDALRLVSGERYETFTTRAANAYRRLSPPPDAILPRVQSIVRRRVWPKRVARWLAWLLLLGFIAAMAWVVWALKDRVEI